MYVQVGNIQDEAVICRIESTVDTVLRVFLGPGHTAFFVSSCFHFRLKPKPPAVFF